MLTVGEILKKEREKKGYSLSKIEKEIKIREKFLKAVEDNDWKSFSSKIYIVGIIKNYAKCLNIPPEKAIAYFHRDYDRKEEIRFKRKIASHYLTPETKKIFFAILFFIFGAFFIYFGFQLKTYFSPPKIDIISPKENIFKKGDSIKVIGKTDKDAVITVANERVYQNKEGIFEFNYPLNSGKNLLTIEVVGANGRKTIISKEYFKQGEVKD